MIEFYFKVVKCLIFHATFTVIQEIVVDKIQAIGSFAQNVGCEN